MVTVEVLLIDGNGDVVRSIESADEPLKQLQRLEEEESLSSVTRMRLTTLEQLPASVQVGQRVNLRSMVAGGPGGGFGGGRTSAFRGENTGTILSVTARVAEDNAIILSVQFEQSRLASTAPRDPAAGEDPTSPPDIATITAQSTVRVPGGGVQVLGGGRSSNGKTSEQSLILVTAQAGEPVAGGAAADTAEDAAGHQLKIMHLAHAEATGLVDMLSILFPRHGDLTIAADPRTNALLVRGSAEKLAAIEAIVARLDETK
jgi:type II secretory pathway component GspD/PulD (secretin)